MAKSKSNKFLLRKEKNFTSILKGKNGDEMGGLARWVEVGLLFFVFLFFFFGRGFCVGLQCF